MEETNKKPKLYFPYHEIFQAAETVDIMDEIRTVYNAFLPLFPYCYAYWKRYSELERKKVKNVEKIFISYVFFLLITT